MSIMLANFGKYAISDCPFIILFKHLICKPFSSNFIVIVAIASVKSWVMFICDNQRLKV